jgi:FtsH-binding integral membrane protein
MINQLSILSFRVGAKSLYNPHVVAKFSKSLNPRASAVFLKPLSLYLNSREFSSAEKKGSIWTLDKDARPAPTVVPPIVREIPLDKSLTNREILAKDCGTQNFLTKVFKHTGLSLAYTFGMAEILLNIPAVQPYISTANMIGLLAIFPLAMGFYATPWKTYTTQNHYSITFEQSLQLRKDYEIAVKNKEASNQSESSSPFSAIDEFTNSSFAGGSNIVKLGNRFVIIEEYHSKNPPLRWFFYGLTLTVFSFSIVPLLAKYPDLIMPSLVASSTCFASASLWVLSQSNRKIAAWEPAVAGGITAFAVMALLQALAGIFDFPVAYWVLRDVRVYVGIPFFTLVTAYDTNMAIKMYQERKPDHLAAAFDLYLDFLMLFAKFTRVFQDKESGRFSK